MAAITQKISNFLGGVSKQPDDKKVPGQVREAINAYPDPTFGLSKRPGTKWLGNLSSTANQFADGKWFYINRDNIEKYIGVIYGTTVKIWNVDDPTVPVTVTNTGTGYLTYGTSTPKDALHMLTVQDTTIVVNNTVTVTTQAAPPFTAGKDATIRLFSAEYGAEYVVTINGTPLTTVTTRNGENTAWDYTTTNAVLSVTEIIDDLYPIIDAAKPAGSTVTKLRDSIEISGATSPFTISVRGGISSEELKAFQLEVNSFGDLPAQSIHGRVVKVNNTVNKEDAYYLKFIAENTTYNIDGSVNVPGSGKGIWEETIAPNVSEGLNASTMPHQLVNTALNTFTFGPATYEDRLVGDDTTNKHPSFVGEKIENAFFQNNRLGFLSKDNVILSQSGEFYNFYSASALTVVDSDPIDISCSALRPAVLHTALPSAQGLVLFSRSQQFLLYSDDGILTPKSSVIRTIANYENDVTVNPVDVGTNMIFASKSTGYTRIYAMATRGQQENPDVQDIGRIVSEWIPDTVDDLTISSQNSFFALYGAAAPYVYFFKTYTVGDEIVMQAWYNWKMHGNVNFFVCDNDDAYIVTYQPTEGQYILLSTNLTQTPEEAILRADDGQVVQLCLDAYSTPASASYNSSTRTNKCYLRYNDVPSLSPAVVIADPNNTGESGFTVTPTRGTDGGGDYFEFQGDDYSTVPNTIYLGYKYDFDIELPRFYYQNGDQGADYTAYLAVSRVKVSVALSSNLGFKLQAAGNSEWYDIQSVQEANYYLGSDVPLSELNIYTLPIHQRNENFTLKLFSDSPFPVALTSMTWEGNYSPRYYRRS